MPNLFTFAYFEFKIALMISATMSPYFSSGPLKNDERNDSADTCRKTWWYNMLYINNIFREDPDIRSEVFLIYNLFYSIGN